MVARDRVAVEVCMKMSHEITRERASFILSSPTCHTALQQLSRAIDEIVGPVYERVSEAEAVSTKATALIFELSKQNKALREKAEILEAENNLLLGITEPSSIFEILTRYICHHTRDEDGNGLPLINPLSPYDTVAEGALELELLADHISGAVMDAVRGEPEED